MQQSTCELGGAPPPRGGTCARIGRGHGLILLIRSHNSPDARKKCTKVRNGSTTKIREAYRRRAERSHSGRYFPQIFITRFNEGIEARKKSKRGEQGPMRARHV